LEATSLEFILLQGRAFSNLEQDSNRYLGPVRCVCYQNAMLDWEKSWLRKGWGKRALTVITPIVNVSAKIIHMV